VFLWVDECQFFVNSYDIAKFQSTCREYRVATVLMSQNISTLYAALGGTPKAKYEIDSLFGNLNTKIFHSNGDAVTNEWAAGLIGKTRQYLVNASSSYQAGDWLQDAMGFGNGQQSTGGVNECFEFEVQPTVFGTLRRGGRQERGQVDAIVYQSGKTFADTGRPWRFATFQQSK
jgi:hypothetical protein